MLTLEEKLEAFGQLHKEVSLYRLSQGSWRLMVGNPSEHVLLGEVDGIYQVNGDSILDVIEKMSELLLRPPQQRRAVDENQLRSV